MRASVLKSGRFTVKKYICWGDDKEDLTERMYEEMKAITYACDLEGVAFGKRKRRRICVVCSKGHENIFEVGEDKNG
jgi:hypothetical protein